MSRHRFLVHLTVGLAGLGLVWAMGSGAAVRGPSHPRVVPVTIRTELSTAASGHAEHAALPSTLLYALERNTTVDDSVTRWNPCQPIRWQINLHGAPAGALRTATEAVRRVGKASGLRFVYAGTTSAIPQSDWGANDDPPLTIAWARPGHGPGRSDLLPGGQVVGMGGTRSVGTVVAGVLGLNMHISTAYVVLDADATRYFPPTFAAQPSLGALLMHELGHAVGLGHAGDRNEIMYPTPVPGHASRWGTGDRVALRLVGAGAGCIATS
ncbi:MAG TPA: matrixin family metalloprotease [Mycobacteriales bacterium]|nr:matrixin family metalloprotease [Mycobacteriales bacterium]